MPHPALNPIRIVLVEPEGPLNVGSVARVMKNMGLGQLVLVNPQCDWCGFEAKKMAVHAIDILQGAQVVETLPEALHGTQRTIATTGRDLALPTHLERPRTALRWLLGIPSALVFGAEYRGLSNEELKYAQRFVRIPSTEEYPSLNLAQAVTVCAYELYNEAIEPETTPILTSSQASIESLEGYYKHLEALLLRIGYLYPHTASARMEKIRRLYNRAELSAPEVSMLRGMLRQVEWGLSQIPTIDDTLNETGES
ncbi:MAG: RNA methyltransferase [Cyanobacteriota bacterium]|nr:RNA methyltransferase [Cyanobacteriota bacterium]